MIYISYRGIFDGNNFEDANTPNQLGKALGMGFSCMIDVWKVNDKFFLGNDQPITEVTAKYLQGNRWWINARNSEMQAWLPTQNIKLYPNYFWFPTPTESTPVTSSSGKLITPGTVPINNTSIIFLPEISDRGCFSTVKLRCFGVCSNYLTFIRRMRQEGAYY